MQLRPFNLFARLYLTPKSGLVQIIFDLFFTQRMNFNLDPLSEAFQGEKILQNLFPERSA